MKRTIALMLGLAVAGALFTANLSQAADKQQNPTPPPCEKGKNCPEPGKNCPQDGSGKGMQKRQGWGKGNGQMPGKGFRGGPRDGSGPRRDGTGGQCPANQS